MSETEAARMPDGLENFLEESEETASSRRPAVSSTASLQRALAHASGTSLALAARLRLVMTSTVDGLSRTMRSRAPVSRARVAIAALCVLGSAEAGWLGL